MSPPSDRNHAMRVTSSDETNRVAITSLISPPGLAPFESFHQHSPSRGTSLQGQRAVPQPISPPISPLVDDNANEVSSLSPTVSGVAAVVVDPLLFTDTAGSPGRSPRPLFGEAPVSAAAAASAPVADELSTGLQARYLSPRVERAIANHVATEESRNLFRTVSPPRPEHYRLAIYLQSTMHEQLSTNPRGMLRERLAELRADNEARRQAAALTRPTGITESDRPFPPSTPARVRRSANGRVSRPRTLLPSGGLPSTNASQNMLLQSVETAPVNGPAAAVEHPARRPARRRSDAPTRRRRSSGSPAAAGSSTAARQPRSRRTSPTAAGANRTDTAWESLPDYCPPLSSLPNPPTNCMKINWHATPLDLSQDPLAHLLHPDELALAASIRLECATYLASKRRFFMSRLAYARDRKDFKKTHAQNACKIDVNKASRMWTAFEKVGWLDIQYMYPFM